MQDANDFFWELVVPLLQQDGISRSTMMGYPCLRKNGTFFTSVEPKSGHLIVKLPAARVLALIEEGTGKEFVPNGRRFREWVLIENRDEARWKTLISEAMEFVG